jgi:hypothetical protein
LSHHFHPEDHVATRKKKTPTRAKPAHSDSGSDHDPTWFSIGRLIRIKKKTKGRKATKATKNDIKELLAWVATQL